jgi:hypothetical protein
MPSLVNYLIVENLRNNYLILCATLLFAATSCSEDFTEIYPASDNAINYRVGTTVQSSNRSSDTRALLNASGDTIYATIAESPIIEASTTSRGTPIYSLDEFKETGADIAVYAYYNSTSGETATLIDDELLLSDKDWSMDKTYYWPKSGNLDFIAYTPTTLDYSDKKISYEMSDDATEQPDMLVAYAPEQTSSTNNCEVQLAFKHICSKLTFKLDTSLPAGIVRSIKIKGLKYIGEYDVVNKEWSVKDDTRDILLDELAKPTQAASTESDYDDTAASAEKTLMLIPQTATDVSLEVTMNRYEIVYDATGAISGYKVINDENDTSNTFTLNYSSLTFKPGNGYTLTIRRDMAGITADADQQAIVYTDFDSYYFVTKYEFTLQPNTKSWKIVSNQEWLTFRTDVGYYQKLGFWVDEERGEHSVEGSVTQGNNNTVTVYAFCDENYSSSSISDRDATIMLIEDNKLTDCKFMRQLAPKKVTKSSLSYSYYTANMEYEDIDGNNSVSTWGYHANWGTMSFTSSTVDLKTLTGISATATDNPIYVTESGGTQTLTINFSYTVNYVYTVEDSGETNSTNLFYHTDKTNEDNKGLWYLLQMALALSRIEGVTTNGSISTFLDCAMVRAVQYNKFTLVSKYGVDVPELASLKWSLPSKNEIDSNGIDGSYNYWASTGYPNSTAYYFYKSGNSYTTGTISRETTGYHIRAIRYID